MQLYAGIDLHANNSYLAVINDNHELVEGLADLFARSLCRRDG